ncbi:hypothetical protein VCHC42A1_3089, partial [Vibrio cholerae HC-42A1]
MRQVWFHK